MPWRGAGRQGIGASTPAPVTALGAEALARLRQQGVALGYDPAQNGWVPLAATEADSGLSRLHLRPWRAEDAPAFTALLDDAEVWRWLPEPYPDPLTEAMARDLIELSNAAPHHIVRAVEHAGQPVGQVRLAFAPGDSLQVEAELSYWLGRAHWGAGLGPAMVTQFVQQMLADRPGLQGIFARVHRDNPASARVAQSAGLTLVGPAPDDPEILVFRRGRGTLS